MIDQSVDSPRAARPRERGSVKERWPGVWVVRLYVGKDAAGKRVYYHYTVRGTERQARAKLQALVRRHEATGDAVPLSRQTFGEWAHEFVEVWGGALSERTRQGLRYCFAHFVPLAMQATKLAALTPARLQAWVNELSARGLAPRTVAKALTEVRWCLEIAAEHGKVPRNAAERVKAPKAAHAERVWLKSEQATRFLAAAEGDRLCAFFVLALLTGARPAELLALTWADVAGDTLVIQRSIVNGANKTRVLAETKTGRVRRIPLGEREIAALARHRRAQVAFRLARGAAYHDQDFIFASETGSPLEAHNIVTRHFKPLLKTAKLPNMRLYDLRHSCASLMADAGEDPKVIQERLGHASIQTTYNNYVHAHPDAQARATAALNRAVSGA